MWTRPCRRRSHADASTDRAVPALTSAGASAGSDRTAVHAVVMVVERAEGWGDGGW